MKKSYVAKLQNTLSKKASELNSKDKTFLQTAYSSANKGQKTLKITDDQKFGSIKSALGKKVTELDKQVKSYKPGNVVYSTGGSKPTLGDFMK